MAIEMTNVQAIITASNIQPVTPEQAYDIGIEAYCYFYPLVLMEITRRQATNIEPNKRPGFGPANSFSHMRAYPDANFKAVVRPNFDTLYSSAWLDLTQEPVIISVPDSAGRYYLLPMLDMWSDVFASPGWRTTGTGTQWHAIVPPGWSGALPAGVERIDAPTSFVWIIGRVKTDGPDDYRDVHAFQDGLAITPVSHWEKKSLPSPAVTIDASIDMTTAPLETINRMSAQAYFAKAAELLKSCRPHLSDWSMIARLQRIGIGGCNNFDADKLDPSVRNELFRGAADALNLMAVKTKTMGKAVNGWAMNTDTMGVYGNYYLKRAIVAMVGLGANQPEDAIYPLNFADADGEPLMGEREYILRFDKDKLPPVNAFWSLTMYDSDGFQVPNSINRFALSSWMPLKKNADGSLDIYIQHDSPGKDKESNWLPAPSSGVLGVTMRLYAPRENVLNGDWLPPVINKARRQDG